MTKRKIDYIKVISLLIILLVSFLLSYFGQPLIHNNSNAISVIITFFAVLAGFLVAVMTLAAVPGAKSEKAPARSDKSKLPNAYSKLVKQSLLFWLYLLILLLVFIATLITPELTKGGESKILVNIERAYLTLAVVAFIYSWRLPLILIELQMGQFKRK